MLPPEPAHRSFIFSRVLNSSESRSRYLYYYTSRQSPSYCDALEDLTPERILAANVKLCAASLLPIHCARLIPGTSPSTSFTSHISLWCVISPCSLKDNRVMMRSWRWSGEGNGSVKEVRGIGSAGEVGWGVGN